LKIIFKEEQIMLKRTILGTVVLGVVAAIIGIAQADKKEESKEPKYEGSKKCQNCHDTWYMDFQKTKMNNSFDILKPGERAEAKTKSKLDPKKDYTHDADCLKCHTTGYGEKGGCIPKEKLSKVTDKAMLKKAGERNKEMEGSGCESCHGPGSEYAKIMKEVKEEKKADPETEKALVAAGLILPGRTDVKAVASTTLVCFDCHNKSHPNHKEFIPEEKLGLADTAFHKHYKLKYIKHVYPVIIEPKKQ
jgi:nitrate/TMAO reductase-like tetraheme cytochrome c subunit